MSFVVLIFLISPPDVCRLTSILLLNFLPSRLYSTTSRQKYIISGRVLRRFAHLLLPNFTGVKKCEIWLPFATLKWEVLKSFIFLQIFQFQNVINSIILRSKSESSVSPDLIKFRYKVPHINERSAVRLLSFVDRPTMLPQGATQ